jgi:outer membrane protein OmpA-like peptidoglycan-associated protein
VYSLPAQADGKHIQLYMAGCAGSNPDSSINFKNTDCVMTSTRNPYLENRNPLFQGKTSLFYSIPVKMLFLLPLLFSLRAVSQTAPPENASTLGLHFLLYDFQSAPVFKNQYNLDKGIGIDFVKASSHNITWEAGLNGLFTFKAKKAAPAYPDRKFMAEGLFAARLKMFSDQQHFLQPFLTAGAGLSYYESGFNLFLPLGPGLQIKSFNNGFIVLKAQYRLALAGQFTNSYFYGAGFSGIIGRGNAHKKKKQGITVPAEESLAVKNKPFDRDHDGIPDSVDACPDIPGIIAFKGCPDTDGDGIEDSKDKCPTVAGLAKYNGCPIPDTDGDGINDEEDACPNTPGLALYKGCPAPDSANNKTNVHDTLKASVLKRPAIKQSILKLVEKAAHNLFFVSGSYELSPQSYQALDTIVAVYRSYPSLRLGIEGYSDNQGDPVKNKILSEKRAEAVKEYLVRRGIAADRIKAMGYGQEKPVAPNTSEKGRARNRRVVMKLVVKEN